MRLDKPTGGRPRNWQRLLGAAMLAHFAVVCAVKLQRDSGAEIVWLSHVGLLLAGVGLLIRSRVLTATAFVSTAALHGLWLVDYFSWWLIGSFPLGVTRYLLNADAWSWIATAHHFYLNPLLLIILLRSRCCPRVVLPASIATYLVLTVFSQACLPRAANVNWAFGLGTELDWAFIHWTNRQARWLYLLGLNAFVAIVFFVPAYLMLRRRALPDPEETDPASELGLPALRRRASAVP